VDERFRVAGTFGRYRRSRRKQRAWAAGRPGNIAIKDELAGHILRIADVELRSGDVLDMGCGSGWWLERLARVGIEPSRLYGVDLLPERILTAGARTPAATVQTADVRNLPFETGRFSVVTLLLVLSSLADRTAMQAALGEALRVSSVHGAVVIWEPRISNPLNTATSHVPEALVHRALGPATTQVTLTLVPALARRLPQRDQYSRLARLSPLRTHRLLVHHPHAALRTR
jgi:ubiquinone/menaquinone biosynthesis C-methylase UbiE